MVPAKDDVQIKKEKGKKRMQKPINQSTEQNEERETYIQSSD